MSKKKCSHVERIHMTSEDKANIDSIYCFIKALKEGKRDSERIIDDYRWGLQAFEDTLKNMTDELSRNSN